MKKIMLCFMLIFAMSLMTACSSSNNETTAMETTMAPTTSSTGTGSMESTGVIDGMADDVKKGAEDVMDGAENAVDMTTTAAH